MIAQAIDQIRNFVGPETLILSLLNGIESEALIAEQLGIQPLYSFVVETDAGRNGQVTEYRTLRHISRSTNYRNCMTTSTGRSWPVG